METAFQILAVALIFNQLWDIKIELRRRNKLAKEQNEILKKSLKDK